MRGRPGGPRGRGGWRNPAAVYRLPRRRPIRRSQLITPFGVGAMNDFRNDEALMCAGLDRWFPNPPDPSLIIHEERPRPGLRATTSSSRQISGKARAPPKSRCRTSAFRSGIIARAVSGWRKRACSAASPVAMTAAAVRGEPDAG
jgi:hypothetical protein